MEITAMMFYSESTGGFYDTRIHGGNIPADAVEISAKDHDDLINGQSSGKRIVADSSGRPNLADPPEPTANQLAAKIPALRYAEEAKGVTLNGVRYAGDESNRQALREAVDMATKAGRTVFETWKDSDGNYLPNHPVSEIDQALDAIFQRRSDLIGLEGKYVKQVLDGVATDLSTLDWTTP